MLTIEELLSYTETKNKIWDWAKKNLSQYQKDYDCKESNYYEDINNVTVNNTNKTLNIETSSAACGGGCCGSNYYNYSVPFDYIFSSDFRLKIKEEIRNKKEKERLEQELKEIEQEKQMFAAQELNDKIEFERLSKKFNKGN